MIPGAQALLDRLVMELAARASVPDRLVRAAFRHRLAAAGATGPRTSADRITIRERLASAPFVAPASSPRPDPPASFFAPWLGPRMKYSGALWSTGAANLAAAEEAMLELTCERARLADGQSILDLGCGWGAFALFAAARYPAARVTAMTDSPAQAAYVAAAAAAQGRTGVCVVEADVRSFEPGGRFDRIVAIESFEHVRNWPALLRRVDDWLAPDGRLFVQAITAGDTASTFEPGEPGAWLARRFLPLAVLPDDPLLASLDEPLVEEARWILSGLESARTVEAWLERFDHAGRRGDAEARRWRLLLLASAELFASDHGRAWRMVHTLLRRRPLR